MSNLGAWLEIVGATLWIVAAIVEIKVRRREHQEMLKTMVETIKESRK